MARTKKVGSSGRFGARYGKKIKTRVAAIEKTLKMKHECPSCSRKTLKREASGIWACSKCRARLTGKAYAPTS